MIRMIFTTGCLACMVIIGAATVAFAGPNFSKSGPAVSNSTTSTTTSTTTASKAPTYPGRSGY